MLTFVSKSINLYVKVTQNVLKNGGRIIKTLERFCYVETGFSSDLVLETIETTSGVFVISKPVSVSETFRSNGFNSFT